jgi:hypothetical protein
MGQADTKVTKVFSLVHFVCFVFKFLASLR